jgi:hypothetical protein
MSTLTIGSNYPITSGAVNSGASAEAASLERIFRRNFEDFRERDDRNQLANELEKAIKQASEPNWDGCGSSPTLPGIQAVACRFLNVLPSAYKAPLVGIDPDGEVNFEWYVDKWHQFSLSIAPDGRASYAGRFGVGNKQHGTESFDDTIPQAIVSCLQRIAVK